MDDNILGIKLTCPKDGETIIVYCVYLPPEGSCYSAGNENILNNLTIEIYRNSEADTILICGDFNARIGNNSDIQSWDDMSPRQVIDSTHNAQGEKLLTLVNNIKGCINNGRVTPEHNDFTSVTGHKGRSVVDYFITWQSDIPSMLKCEVHSPTAVIDDSELDKLLCEGGSIPDHSILTLVMETSTLVK